MPGVAGEGIPDGEAVRVQALKNDRAGLNFLRPGFRSRFSGFGRVSGVRNVVYRRAKIQQEVNLIPFRDAWGCVCEHLG